MTSQYAGLRTLHHDNQARGFTVLGFPCNQFGAQEPGTNDEILEFARSRYDVDFPLFAKIDVNGEGSCALYDLLKSAHADPEGKADIAWNYTKFLVNRSGQVVARFEPKTTPEEIAAALTDHL